MATVSPAQPRRAETRLFPSEAAGSELSEAYPLGYVAAKVATENEAGGHFQQPSRQRLDLDR